MPLVAWYQEILAWVTLPWLASSPEKVFSNWCVPYFRNMVLGTGEEQEALLCWILLCALVVFSSLPRATHHLSSISTHRVVILA